MLGYWIFFKVRTTGPSSGFENMNLIAAFRSEQARQVQFHKFSGTASNVHDFNKHRFLTLKRISLAVTDDIYTTS
jgi:hypothetical protein